MTMSAASDCNCACATPTVTNIPGSTGATGAAGTNGTNGINAFTTLTTGFSLPGAPGAAGLQAFGSTAWMAINQIILISDPNGTDFGSFRVGTIPDGTHANLTWLNYPGDAIFGTALAALSRVVPVGVKPALAVALPAAFTDSTNGTATAGGTLAAGVGIFTIAIPLASLVTGIGTLAIDLLTSYVPGYRFALKKFDWVTTVVGTGPGASQSFNLAIGATNVTGGVVNPVLASTNIIGAVTAGSAISALNIGTAANAISIKLAAGGTVFTAGGGYFLIQIQNLDVADAVANLNASINSIKAAVNFP